MATIKRIEDAKLAELQTRINALFQLYDGRLGLRAEGVERTMGREDLKIELLSLVKRFKP